MRRVVGGASLVLAVSAAAWASAWGSASIRATSTETRLLVPARPDDRTIAHVLNRIGFGPTPGDIARVRAIGLDAYIDQQLHPGRIADSGLASRLSELPTLAKNTGELTQEYFLPAQMARQRQQRAVAGQAMPAGTDPGAAAMPDTAPSTAIGRERIVLLELSQQKILRATYSERQLEEVMVDFWFNHFNVFAAKGLTRVYLSEYERDAIRPHVLGRFRDLLQATAESPAMLFYLDNWQSAAPSSAAMSGGRREARREPGRAAVADRQRTITGEDRPRAQQNRRRGLNENYARELMELHTLGVDGGYSQKDVQEVARAFTGWTIANPRQGGPFTFVPRMHDDGEKTVLGHRIESGGGKSDGEQVLDILAGHPSTARHIATKLARRFVSDEPPPALVDRAAKRFLDTRGDIREVVRTIIESPEFFASASYRAKVKSPFEFVVSALRAIQIDVVNALPLVGSLRQLGMPLYLCQSPTGYGDKAEAWVNAGALLNRMNFAVALTGGRMRGIRSDTARATAVTAAAVLTGRVLAGDVSSTTSATVARATTAPQAMALVLGSPDFQKR
jgi:uncharacterized protein (DUF1800 family)